MDTGSSLLMGSALEITTLVNAIGADNDCANYDSLPDLFFVMMGKGGEKVNLILTKHEYMDKSDWGCAPLMHPLELPPGMPPMLILGQSFFQKYYMVFDGANMQ